MPTIIFITPDGKRHETDVESGYSVMEAAINNNIDGIVGWRGTQLLPLIIPNRW